MTSGGQEFGGYLPLELPPATGEYYEDSLHFSVISLNSGRATFYAAAINAHSSKVFLPYLTCVDTSDPFRRLGLEIEHYQLDDNLLPLDVEPKRGDLVVWTNYYGNASNESLEEVAKRYENQLIVDNCHAFFSEPVEGAMTSYSARKFFGVSDGAYLLGSNIELPSNLPFDESYQRLHHLALQIERDINAGYRFSLLNEKIVASSYSQMSKLSRQILATIDYPRIQQTRWENFSRLHELLVSKNEFAVNLSSKTHMYYPFMCSDRDLRKRLVGKKVYSPQWWDHVPALVPFGSVEERLSREMVMLPIDQRYDVDDMGRLAELVLGELRSSSRS